MAHLFNNNNDESFQCEVGRSGTPEEITSLGRQSCLPGQEQVRRKRPRPPLSFTGEQQHALQVRAKPRRALRLSPREHRPRGTRRPFCACAARLAPPSALRTPLPPNLKARLSGPTGPRRPMDTAGVKKRSPGARGGHRRAAATAGLQPPDTAPSPRPSTPRQRAVTEARGRAAESRESRVDSAFNPRFRDNRVFVLLLSTRFCPSALFPSPWSCPCSLQSGFWWVVGSKANAKLPRSPQVTRREEESSLSPASRVGARMGGQRGAGRRIVQRGPLP